MNVVYSSCDTWFISVTRWKKRMRKGKIWRKENNQVSAYNLKKMVFNETETETESQFQCECEFDAVQPKPNGLKVDQSNPGPLEKKPSWK